MHPLANHPPISFNDAFKIICKDHCRWGVAISLIGEMDTEELERMGMPESWALELVHQSGNFLALFDVGEEAREVFKKFRGEESLFVVLISNEGWERGCS